MNILVIDGQGGGVGKALAEKISTNFPEDELVVVGTNSMATANMLKGGGIGGATGENAVVYNAARADVIVGPMGIVMAHAMLGEITPRMAEAVGASRARKILIPINRCVTVAGVDEALTLSEYIKLAVDKI